MKIKHTLELDGEELELEIYVLVTSWASDDRGRPVIEDLEFEQIALRNENGGLVVAEGEIEQDILNLLGKDVDFVSKIYTAAIEDGEDALAERAIQRAESAREAVWENRRGN